MFCCYGWELCVSLSMASSDSQRRRTGKGDGQNKWKGNKKLGLGVCVTRLFNGLVVVMRSLSDCSGQCPPRCEQRWPQVRPLTWVHSWWMENRERCSQFNPDSHLLRMGSWNVRSTSWPSNLYPNCLTEQNSIVYWCPRLLPNIYRFETT